MQQKHIAEPRPDYQFFEIGPNGQVVNIGQRMQKKLQAIPLPDLKGKTVLDVGCDFGFWSFLSANRGAHYVLGLDRNRPVRGFGYADLINFNRGVADRYDALSVCDFAHVNIGRDWPEYGRFDVVYVFSLYHHIYENCADHKAIWYWLHRHLKSDGQVLWENPTDCRDVVSKMNISDDKKAGYNKDAIMAAAGHYFDIEYIGPALHEPHREVYRFKPKKLEDISYSGVMVHGAGGASKAFQYAQQRRVFEIDRILGYAPIAGSLNIKLDAPFHWNDRYFRAEVLDVKDRSKGLESEWEPRWARFYPVTVAGVEGHAFRFEGESYALDFIEVISPIHMRSFIKGETVTVKCSQ